MILVFLQKILVDPRRAFAQVIAKNGEDVRIIYDGDRRVSLIVIRFYCSGRSPPDALDLLIYQQPGALSLAPGAYVRTFFFFLQVTGIQTTL